MKHFWLILLLFFCGFRSIAYEDCTEVVGLSNPIIPSSLTILENRCTLDTITPPEKYLGYRLFLSAFQIQKKTEHWVRLQMTVTNTGKYDIDLSQKGTEHWLQFQFDPSLFANKLGGLRPQIRYAFYDSGLKIKAGKTILEYVLKVKTFPNIPASSQSLAAKSTSGSSKSKSEKIVFAAKDDKPVTQKDIQNQKVQCPDLVIEDIKVLSQSKKWLTVEYTLANLGKGPVDLIERAGSDKVKLAVRAHISGVPKLSNGALSIGGGYVGLELKDKGITLFPGDRHKEKLKVDIRPKTRYMKHLILSLDAHELRYECDRTNNTNAIELE